MIRTYAFQVSFLALAAALLLASTQISRPDNWPLIGLYAYWCVRILIEAGLFVAFAELIGRVSFFKKRLLAATILATLISLVPFALSVTALDLILGLPELDGSIGLLSAAPALATDPQVPTQIGSFLREIIFLSDNHLALCLLLSAPKLFRLAEDTSKAFKITVGTADDRDNTGFSEEQAPPTSGKTEDAASGLGYRRHLDHPLKGDLIRVEAQEHYVRLISRSDSQMLLYRFNDIVSELSAELGMQVHRSHWVAYDAVERLLREESRLWVMVSDGSRVPVSRKYAEDVRLRMGRSESAPG